MPHSKFSEKPAFNENHGFLKCTCVQFLEFKSKREEKLKIRLHSKNCLNSPEDFETIKPPKKDLVKQRRNMLAMCTLKSFINNIYPVGSMSKI